MKIPKVNTEASGDPNAELYVKIQKSFKELAINKGKKMYESDINPPPNKPSENYPQQMLKLNIAFFDIETDFDPEKGFADCRSFMSHYSSRILTVDGNNDLFSSSIKTLTMDRKERT